MHVAMKNKTIFGLVRMPTFLRLNTNCDEQRAGRDLLTIKREILKKLSVRMQHEHQFAGETQANPFNNRLYARHSACET